MNVHASSTDRVYDAFEFITVASGSRSADCPNPGQFVLGGSAASALPSSTSSGGLNVFREPAVEHKLCYSTADKLVVSPYQKPIRLLKRLIGMFSKEGDRVDGCAGSGSTMVAAATLGRNVLAVDIDPRCCQFMHLRTNSLDSVPTEAEEIGEEPLADAIRTFRKEPMVGVKPGGRGSFVLLGRRRNSVLDPGVHSVHTQGSMDVDDYAADDSGTDPAAVDASEDAGSGGSQAQPDESQAQPDASEAASEHADQADSQATDMDATGMAGSNALVPDSCPLANSEDET